jgi:AraC-like DNA-binding protein
MIECEQSNDLAVSVDMFKTTEKQVVREYMNSLVTTHNFEVTDSAAEVAFDFKRLNIGDFQVCDFSYGDCEVDIKLNHCDEHKFFIVVPLSGYVDITSADSQFTLRPGSAWAFSTPDATNTRFHDSSNFRNINICLSYGSLRKFLSNDFDLPITQTINFPAHPISVNADFRFLLDYIEWFTTRFDADVNKMLLNSAHLTKHMHDMLMSMLISAVDNNFQELYCSKNVKVAAPNYVRMAEEYMRCNACEAITVKEVAKEVGVAMRTLHGGFQKYRNYSVSEFLRNERLHLARTALATANQNNLTVTDVAYSSGFFHLSKFAVAYQKKFGENPSETLRRVS